MERKQKLKMTIQDMGYRVLYLPKEAVWNVVTLSATLTPPVMTVLPIPSPMNIKFVFFLPTFNSFSSYLQNNKQTKKVMKIIVIICITTSMSESLLTL